jgi:hypothetical protein
VLHVLVNVHNGRLVAAAVAVVGRAEHGDHRPLVLPQEAFRHKLVRANDELEAVDMVEVLRDVLQLQVGFTVVDYGSCVPLG